MAGTVGAGAVGNIAIVYGYQRFDSFAMFSTDVLYRSDFNYYSPSNPIYWK